MLRLNKRLKIALRLALGSGLLLFLIFHFGWEQIASTMRSVPLSYSPLVLVAIGLSHWLNGLGFWILARDYTLPMGPCFLMSLRSWALGMFTPGRLGEFSMAYFLKQAGIPLGEAAAMTFLARFVMIVLLALMAAAGAMVFEFRRLAVEILLSLLCLLAAFALLMAWKGGRRFVSERFLKALGIQLEGFTPTLKAVIGRQRARLFGLAVVNLARLFLLFATYRLLFFSLNHKVDFLAICAINSMGRIVSLIPISINGLGMRESLQVWLYERCCQLEGSVVISVALWVNILLYFFAFAVFILFPIRPPREG